MLLAGTPLLHRSTNLRDESWCRKQHLVLPRCEALGQEEKEGPTCLDALGQRERGCGSELRPWSLNFAPLGVGNLPRTVEAPRWCHWVHCPLLVRLIRLGPRHCFVHFVEALCFLMPQFPPLVVANPRWGVDRHHPHPDCFHCYRGSLQTRLVVQLTLAGRPTDQSSSGRGPPFESLSRWPYAGAAHSAWVLP